MSSRNVLLFGNDLSPPRFYPAQMADPRHDWYLKEWLKYADKTQQWLADQLDVQKSKVSRLATGVTPYDRDDVNAVARALNLAPFELLIPPDEAHHIRRLRTAAADEYHLRAAEQRSEFKQAEASPDRLLPRKAG